MKTATELARDDGICTWLRPPDDVIERIDRFSDLIRADERETCALIAENHPAYDWHKAPCEITYAIRARGYK
ncbi:hypothetical protein UFOVP1309_80 [uncultured Caudovirales phage]|uniref:Uncharacterized protein n=1 Tax=uncultured Caudovirales phage TaxID=2100421 RepID=A0A6J5S0L4_9CAUD|nr:hypothetical protein UFOVP1309_80 [uncultured Caudovirales phage]